jgi:AraC-like DNA-binding protein
MILGDQWLSVPAGLGVFVPAGVPQAPHAMRGDRIQMSDWLRILVYPFGVIVHRCRLVPTAHEKSIRYFIPNTTVSGLFHEWAKGLQQPSKSPLRDKSLLCAFLCLVAEATPVPVNPMEMLPENFVDLPLPLRNALLALHSGFNQPFRLKLLAQRCFVSPYYLCRLFRQYLQMTPLEYLVRLRLTIAHQLLEQVGLSVGDVAVLVGYQDWRHFHRLFVRHFGTPPGAVRSHKGALPHRIFKPPK